MCPQEYLPPPLPHQLCRRLPHGRGCCRGAWSIIIAAHGGFECFRVSGSGQEPRGAGSGAEGSRGTGWAGVGVQGPSQAEDALGMGKY